MFKSHKFWLAATVILAVAAALIASTILRNYVGVEKVAAVSRDLQPDQVLTDKDLAIAEVVKGNLYSDAVTPQQAAGKTAIGYIPNGTILRSSMLQSAPATISGKIAALGNDYVAVAILNTLQTSVAGAVNTGDYVDIYAEVPGQGQNATVTTTLLAKGVLVLQGTTTKNNEQKDQSTQGIIISVGPDDFNNLLPYLSGKNGQLVCALLGHPGK